MATDTGPFVTADSSAFSSPEVTSMKPVIETADEQVFWQGSFFAVYL